MSRSSIAMTTWLPWLVLTLLGCQPSTTTTPPEPDASVPVTQEDPIEGDPTDIEREEIGEDYVDSAKVVEPGPAEAEVRKRESLGGQDPS